MKKISFATAVFITVLSFTSCNQEDEQVYSCNKDADAWVKKNMAKVHSMSRSEWENMDETYARAAYVAFTPEQKLNFWREKISQTLTLSWNDKEIAHIKELENFINTHQFIFSGKDMTDDEKDTFELFCYQWCKNAETELGWSKETTKSIIASGYKLKNTKGEIIQNKIKPMSTMRTATESGTASNCNCSTKVDFCTGITPCEPVNCNVSSLGCGLLWLQDCNGRCGGI